MRAALIVSLGLLTAAPQARLAVTHTARAIQPGEVVLMTIDAPAAPRDVAVRAFERDWPVYRDAEGAWHALVGIDLDAKPGTYDVKIAAAGDHATEPLTVARRVFPTRQLTVNPDLVNPPPEMMARVESEAQHLHEIWDHPAPQRLWTSPFVRPVPDEANSTFGTRSIYNGQPRSPHTGADFLSPAGRPVKAPNAGRIVLAAALYFTGNTVIIDHGLGLFSLLAHLSEIDVTTGDMVAAGDIVGKVGATGRVTGPHLHWAVRLNNARVDPLSLLYVLGAAPRGGGPGEAPSLSDTLLVREPRTPHD